MKFIHILLISLATLGVVCGSIQLPSSLLSSESVVAVSNFEKSNHSLLHFLFENDSSEEQNDSEDSNDLEPQEEECNKYNLEFGLGTRVLASRFSNIQVKSNLRTKLKQVQPSKRYILFQNPKVYC